MNTSITSWLIRGYFIVGFLFALYQNYWGPHSYKSFTYHLGQGVIWPAMMFPSVGKFIGGVIIFLIVGGLLLKSK
ncbi:hypothetical protein [Acinetobacter nematophilus]|uniref:Uncharacterized protein n=1 Tax=Acinetobacter nematophilus TaxID=2994642 RepID=A0A9X3DVK0_9GAMM|nr:hypothetical protein [Acinetobacter nematophilus]MCX5468858.1 hypothetical protein [Acinetobacter nematophilus]